MPNISDAFTQGGQTQLHKIRMFMQVMGSTAKVTACIALLSYTLLVWLDHPWQDFWLLLVKLKAWFMVNCPKVLQEMSPSTLVYNRSGTSAWVSDYFVMRDSKINGWINFILWSLFKKVFYAIGIGLLGSVAVSKFWVRMGKQKKQAKVVHGFELVPPKELTKEIKKKSTSLYAIAGVPIPKGAEFQHTMVTGTTGAGKSNMIHQLLQQIREQGDQAIVVDSTAGIFSRFYNQEQDLLLNPLDKRTTNWNLWQEAERDYLLEEIAESMIADNGSYDKFWTNSARQLLCESIRFLIKTKQISYAMLSEMIFELSLKELQETLKKTTAAILIDPAADKMAISIRATLGSHLRSFKALTDDKNGVSLLNFMRDNHKQWLFLSCQSDQRELLQPLFSAWISLIIKGIMRRPEQNNSRTWIIIDELASLNKLPSLTSGLSEIRKYGGCMVLGFQDLSQLESIYTVANTKTISNLTGTKVLFRAIDTEVASRVARYMGEQEKEEANESISFGAHAMRDGVNISNHRQKQTVVNASDIMMLDNLQAFLKYPGVTQIAKVKFDYLDLALANTIFIQK